MYHELRKRGTSPDFSHYSCLICHLAARLSCFFNGRTTAWRHETRELSAFFRGCGGSEEGVSVGLGMMPRLLRVAAPRVRRESRARWPRH